MAATIPRTRAQRRRDSRRKAVLHDRERQAAALSAAELHEERDA